MWVSVMEKYGWRDCTCTLAMHVASNQPPADPIVQYLNLLPLLSERLCIVYGGQPGEIRPDNGLQYADPAHHLQEEGTIRAD